MNILLTSLGFSWHIIPELIGLMNPLSAHFYAQESEATNIRERYELQPVDECWVVTTSDVIDSPGYSRTLLKLADIYSVRLRIFICEDVISFSGIESVNLMRSFIFRVIRKARDRSLGGALYISIAGGRKTMSADMQRGASLFGCEALLHVIDIDQIPEEMKDPASIFANDSRFSAYFLPLVLQSRIEPDPLIEMLSAVEENDLPSNRNFYIMREREDGFLLKAITKIETESANTYTHFFEDRRNLNMKRGIFRELYSLPPALFNRIHHRMLSPEDVNTFELLREFPKCELHSHLGGVLSPEEMIAVATQEEDRMLLSLREENKYQEFSKRVSTLIENEDREEFFSIMDEQRNRKGSPELFVYNILFLSRFKERTTLLSDWLYSLSDDENGIGIDTYQRLGDLQGSAILQTETTIRATLKIYTEKLKRDNVRYLELRCSPYKYTLNGLTEDQVLRAIIEELSSSEIEYSLIIIFGRTDTLEGIRQKIEDLQRLRTSLPEFRDRFAGVDLAGSEHAASPAKLRECFLPLLDDCVNITIHAGETEPSENIWEAVYHLSADRIGHGLTLFERPELMHRFVDKNIGIEMCPSSNDQIIGYKNGGYPLKIYMDSGLKVSLNTDNCGISRTSLSNEFLVASALTGGLSLYECIVLIRNSLSMAFLNPEKKKMLMFRFEDEIKELLLKEVWE